MRFGILLFATAVVAASCGSAPVDVTAEADAASAAESPPATAVENTTTTAEAASTTSLDPAVQAILDDVIPTSSTAAPGVVDPALNKAEAAQACAAFEAALVGPESFLDEADDDAASDAFVSLLRPFGNGIAEAVADGVDDADGNWAILAVAYDQLDIVTLDECGFPGMSALVALARVPVRNRFCAVGQAIDPEAPPPEPAESASSCGTGGILPDVLPCFVATGLRFVDDSTPFAAVDCETEERVDWDDSAGIWAEKRSVEELFAEVEAAID